MKGARTTQAKKTNISSGGATRGKTSRDDFAGKTNPHYILYVDYYGDVYAKFVGPRDVSIASSIWVPKIISTRAPHRPSGLPPERVLWGRPDEMASMGARLHTRRPP